MAKPKSTVETEVVSIRVPKEMRIAIDDAAYWARKSRAKFVEELFIPAFKRYRAKIKTQHLEQNQVVA